MTVVHASTLHNQFINATAAMLHVFLTSIGYELQIVGIDGLEAIIEFQVMIPDHYKCWRRWLSSSSRRTLKSWQPLLTTRP